MRPTKYLRKWSTRDRGLAEGLLTYEESLNELGIPSWIARDATLEWDTDEVMDFPAAAVGSVRDEYTSGGKPNHGLRIVVMPRSAPLVRDADREKDRAEDTDEHQPGSLDHRQDPVDG